MQSSTPRNCRRFGKTHQGRCDTERSAIRCFCCGETGHVKLNCPKKDRACFLCGVLGHRIKYCPRMKRDKSRASVQQPTKVGTSIQKEEVPKARARAFQITAEQARDEPDVIMGMFLVN